MPTVMNRAQPLFRVHDRHPMLHGLAWMGLVLLLLLAFVLSVMSGVWSLPAAEAAGAGAWLPA